MSVKVPKDLGVGGGGLSTDQGDANDGRVRVKDLFNAAARDVLALATAFNGHKHSFDGSQGVSSVTSSPVTGTASGTVAGGTAIGVVTPELTESTAGAD